MLSPEPVSNGQIVAMLDGADGVGKAQTPEIHLNRISDLVEGKADTVLAIETLAEAVAATLGEPETLPQLTLRLRYQD